MLPRHPHPPIKRQIPDGNLASRPRESAIPYFGPLLAVAAGNARNTSGGDVTIATTTGRNWRISATTLDGDVRRAVARMADHDFSTTAACVL